MQIRFDMQTLNYWQMEIPENSMWSFLTFVELYNYNKMQTNKLN